MHVCYCPETSVFEEQVESIADMDQIVDPANLSMHAIQTCDLAGQVLPHQVISEPPIEILGAFSRVDES